MNEVYFQIAVLLYTSLAFAITRASMYVSPCWTQFFIIILLVVLIIDNHHLTAGLIINTNGFVGQSLSFKVNLWLTFE